MARVTQQTAAGPPGTIVCRLGDELLERVFTFLPALDVFILRLVCKRWNVLLRSNQFLGSFDRRNQNSVEKWITFFDGLGFLDERSLLLFDPTLQKWRCVSLAFLPPQFDIAIATAGGLFCVASSTAQGGGVPIDRTEMCVCNPFTKAYRVLPSLQLDLVEAHAIMERRDTGSYKVYVMSSYSMAIYDSSNESWMNINVGENVRPRSPVICHGAIYGLKDEGSQWWESWKLVVSELDNRSSDGLYAGNCSWLVLNQSGEFSGLIRRPRLLGANGCLLLIGGLKKSVLSYSCSAFIIFKLDFMTLNWLEVTRMPEDLYMAFKDLAFVKIFGSTQHVFFFCQKSCTIVACNLLNGQVSWHRVADYPSLRYCIFRLCKGFAFDLKLGSVVQS